MLNVAMNRAAHVFRDVASPNGEAKGTSQGTILRTGRSYAVNEFELLNNVNLYDFRWYRRMATLSCYVLQSEAEYPLRSQWFSLVSISWSKGT